jgi:hypothetical protein
MPASVSANRCMVLPISKGHHVGIGYDTVMGLFGDFPTRKAGVSIQ